MFCSKCGKPANENSLFCTYCGTPMTEAQPESVAAPENAAPSAAESISAEKVPVSVPAQTDFASGGASPAPECAEVSQGSSAPSEVSGVSIVPAATAEKPEKYYTFGHIAMCLAAVAVMAIVAGVFAGLYFSVV